MRKILYTGDLSSYDKLKSHFVGEGVVLLPCIRFKKIKISSSALMKLSDYNNWEVIFTSPRAVSFALEEKFLPSILKKSSVFCFGEKTKEALDLEGLPCVQVENSLTAEQMAYSLLDILNPKKTILLPGSLKRAFDLEGFLKSRGFSVRSLDLYETLSELRDFKDEKLTKKERKNLISDLQGVVCFASPSAVEGFAKVLSPDKNRLGRDLVSVSMGETTCETAQKYFAVSVCASARSVGELLEFSKSYL